MKSHSFIQFILVGLTFVACSKDKLSAEENRDIEFGVVSEQAFNQEGNLNIDKTGNDNDFVQRFTFSIDAYSKFTFSIDNFTGTFSLTNSTKNEWRSYDGGALGGGSNELRFSDSFNFETELDEGEHELIVRGNFQIDRDVPYRITIDNIEELRPYKNLGVLTLPFNESFIPDPERSRRTVYDFEIPESTDWDIFIDRVADAYYDQSEVFLYDDQGNVIIPTGDDGGQGVVVPLQKGRYQLSFDSTTTLILGDDDFGNQDFGEISAFPFSQEFTIDYTYDTDKEQYFYFQTAESTDINIDIITTSAHFISLKKEDGSGTIDPFGSEALPPGSYFIEVTPSSYAYYSGPGNSGDLVYSPLIGTYKLELTASE